MTTTMITSHCHVGNTGNHGCLLPRRLWSPLTGRTTPYRRFILCLLLPTLHSNIHSKARQCADAYRYGGRFARFSNSKTKSFILCYLSSSTFLSTSGTPYMPVPYLSIMFHSKTLNLEGIVCILSSLCLIDTRMVRKTYNHNYNIFRQQTLILFLAMMFL